MALKSNVLEQPSKSQELNPVEINDMILNSAFVENHSNVVKLKQFSKTEWDKSSNWKSFMLVVTTECGKNQ